MSKGIKLSPKHGVNPCIPLCFFCGKEKNEVALLGHIGDGRKNEDFEAPINMVLDYEPCDDCAATMSQGIAVIGVSKNPIQAGQPEIQKGLYPTGSWCVVSENFINRVISDTGMKKDILTRRKCFMEDVLVQQLVGGRQ